jgi:hypothetical protein
MDNEITSGDNKESNHLYSIMWIVILVAANIVFYKFYWILPKVEVLSLNWIHEIVVIILFFASMFFSFGSLLGIFFVVKESGLTKGLLTRDSIYPILYLILGFPLLIMSSWIAYLLRTKMYE